MGTETYMKNGQVSKKKHVAKGQGTEHYQRMYDSNPSMNGAPEGYMRRYENSYRKMSLPSHHMDEM